jgi:transposase-like protein
MTRFAASGRTMAAFCRAESISRSTFDVWREKLRSKKPQKRLHKSSPREFIEVTPAPVPALGGWTVEIELPDEAAIRTQGLQEEAKLEYRALHCKPVVDALFTWLGEVSEKHLLLPTSPFTKAVSYGLEREKGLRVFLEDPRVPIDTNHLEREIRPIALGRRNYLFCWSEIGAQYVGIIQSLLRTSRLQGVDAYTYLVDVLQRVENHPAREVHLLTPRLWKEHFDEHPLRSHIDASRQ